MNILHKNGMTNVDEQLNYSVVWLIREVLKTASSLNS